MVILVAKSCLTCNTMNCSPPGSSIHGVLQARILKLFPSPGDLPNPGIEPGSPALQADFLPSELWGKLNPGVQFSHSVMSDSLWPHGQQIPGLPVHHQLPEFTQTHVHWVGDTIQSSHPLSSPFPALYLSQYLGLLNEPALHIRWPKYWSFSFSISPSSEHSGRIAFRMDWFLQSKGLSRVFSNTTVQKHQFFGARLSLQSNSHTHTWLLEKPQPWLDRPLLAK